MSAKPSRVETAKQRERRLIAAAQAGDQAALAELIGDLQPTIRAVVNKAIARGIPVDPDDLAQEAAIGGLKAIRGFELSRDVRLVTFATRRMWGAILDYARIHNPLGSRAGRQACRHEIATKVKSLSAVCFLNDEGDEIPWEPSDGGVNDELLADIDWEDSWRHVSSRMSDRLRKVMYMRVFEGKTMKQCAAAIGVTESRVSQILAKELPRIVASLQRANGQEVRV